MRALIFTFLALALVLWLGLAVLERMPRAATVLPARDGPALADAKTWGYQLQRVSPAQIPAGIDVLVVDYSQIRGVSGAVSPASVDRLRVRPDGSRRIVLCYLSIGEAENYRPYWRRRWSALPPAWLGPENPAWKGNFAVRYWNQDWQNIIVDPSRTAPSLWDRVLSAIFAASPPYLDQIIDAGFDGVYLDRVDAYEKPLEGRPAAQADMIAFVEKISNYAKLRRPGFFVVPQNGEALLTEANYRRTVDGIAKEDLLYGEAGDGVPNPPADVRAAITQLNRLKADGRPVFVVEYLSSENGRALAAEEFRKLGFVAVFAERGLALPPVIPSAPLQPPAPAIPPKPATDAPRSAP